MDYNLASIANLLGDPARAAMLLKLMTGCALPAGELAFAANISAQTASGHLAKMKEARLVAVQTQGRHRYYRLFGTEVADAIEALLVLTSPRVGQASKQPEKIPLPGTLPHARTCYMHIAGWLGVRIADALQANALLLPAEEKMFAVTDAGRVWFQEIGILLPQSQEKASSKVARQCLDWTERRPHVAGMLGVSLYKQFVSLRWVAPMKNTRAIRVTLEGRRELWRRLRIAV